MATFGSDEDCINMQSHCIDGKLVRHPYQATWNDPRNFSRDQLVPCLSGLSAINYTYTIREIFYSHMLRFGFCQNGDLINPSVLGQMILGGKIYLLYPLLLISYLYHFLDIIVSCLLLTWNEQNQLMCQCQQFGTNFLFKFFHPDWKKVVNDYWGGYPFRDQKEISDFIIAKF